MIGAGTVVYASAAVGIICWIYVSTYLEKR